jgi:hypothetical protein
MKITDPVMKTFTFNELATKAQNHLIHIVSSSTNKNELLFKLAGFYGGLVEVLKENKHY